MNYCNPKWAGKGKLSAGDIAGLQAYYGPASVKSARSNNRSDFNGDGKSDVFFINQNGAGINAYISYGGYGEVCGFGGINVLPGYTNAFDPATTKLTAGDFNGDGKSDVFFINQNAVGINAYISYGGYGQDGRFGPINVLSGYTDAFDPATTKLTAGDFNGDGKSDVFFINKNAVGINAYISYGGYGQGSGFGPINVLSGYTDAFDPAATKLAAGDFNGDGKSDVFFVNHNGAGINAYISYGGYGQGGGFGGINVLPGYTDAFDPDTTNLVSGDFNGDGKSDVFFVNHNGAGINAYISYGGYGQGGEFGGINVLPGYTNAFDPSTTQLASGD